MADVRPEWQMRAFRDAADDCGFQDLGWSGVPYTWDNRQTGHANVKARLDRAFANEGFRQKFEYVKVRYICSVESDHCFVMEEIKLHSPGRSRTKKQFRYENVWQTHVDYDHLVQETWRGIQRGPGLQGISVALGALQQTLELWGSREFGSLSRTVRQLQKRLDRIRCGSIGSGPTDEEKRVAQKQKEALHQEEVWLTQ